MRAVHHPRRDRPQLVTEARPSRSADIAYRERRYLIMMGIRLVCFLIAVLLFVNHAGWLTAIPAVGAIAIPYFAVIFANGGREPNVTRGFRPYEPRLPAPSAGPPLVPARPAAGEPGEPGDPGDPGTPASSGAPPHNA
ncbi:MAG TPA: DUF3099 domain-containing protein [Actinobacteria bacterium]|nr:DUF3099 domain-containing protein [Actinomycetota bacterium]